jgi:aryl-alcohol dehydrogenase-like predicted oxidoreductase
MADTLLPHHFEPRRELGRTGFAAAILGIGDLADRSLPLQTCMATLRRAMDYGLNVIDTAPGYEDGYSEEIVGAAVRGRRDAMFVVDKIDLLDQPAASQVEGSLRRLATDHADLFVFHGLSCIEEWQRLLHPGGGMEQLDRCIAAGKARFKGISCHDPATLRPAVESGLCDVVLFPVGPHVDRRYVEEILPLARRLGVGTICFKTFGAGKLVGDTTGYGRPLNQPPRVDLATRGDDQHAKPVLPHLTVAQCVHYTLTCDPDVALLGMSSADELDAAVRAAADYRPLGTEAMADIREQAARAVQGKGICHWDPK